MARSKGMSLGANILVGLVVLIGIGVAMTLFRQVPKPAVSQPDKQGKEADAIHVAQKQLKTFLAHPLDAEFGWHTSAGLTDEIEGQRNWVVSGTVKAPNDFGAKLTKPYRVALRYDGSTWNTLFVELDGKTVYVDAEAFADHLEKQAPAEAPKPKDRP